MCGIGMVRGRVSLLSWSVRANPGEREPGRGTGSGAVALMERTLMESLCGVRPHTTGSLWRHRSPTFGQVLLLFLFFLVHLLGWGRVRPAGRSEG